MTMTQGERLESWRFVVAETDTDPHLRMTPWDDQDAAVREAWVEHITPEEPWDV